MPALHLRTDQTLHEQLTAIARADGRSLNAYLLGLIRADVQRRQRLANAVGLTWRATDAELADALGAAVSAPLSDIEQAHLPAEPGAAVAFAASRARKRSSKPAPATKPAPSPGTAPAKQRTSASAPPAPAPADDDAEEDPPPEGETEREELERLRRNKARREKKGGKSASSAAIVLSSAEYGRLLALRAQRAGKPPPDRQPSANTFTVQGDDADAQAIVVARGAR